MSVQCSRSCATLLACASLALSGCSEDPGRLLIEVRWPASYDGPQEIYVRSSVQLRGGPDEVRSAPIGPVEFGRPIGFELERVPNGEGHILVIEMVDSPAAELVLLFGISQPFDLAPGKTVELEVPVTLERPPVAAGLALDGGETPFSSPQVTLVLQSDSAVAVELSNQAGFTRDVQALQLEALEGADGRCPPSDSERNPCIYRAPWNLDFGPIEPCIEQDRCRRIVFARFRDARGFRSEVVSVEGTLDTRAPVLVDASVEPELLRADASAAVSFTLQEAVEAADVSLRVELSDAVVARQLPVEDSARSRSFRFEVAPRGGRWPEAVDMRTLAMEVEATDLAGNRTMPPLDLAVEAQLASRIPEISELSVSSTLAAGRTETELSFFTNVPLLPSALEVRTGPIPAPSGSSQGRATMDPSTCLEQGAPDAGRFRWRGCAIDLSTFLLSHLDGFSLPLEVRAVDAAGNQGSAVSEIYIDQVAPSVVAGTRVIYEPGPNTPQLSLGAAGDASTIRVRVGFSEALGLSPSLRAFADGSTLSFSLDTSTGVTAEFVATVDAALHPTNDYLPRLVLADRSGNIGEDSFADPLIRVDVTPDELVVQQSQVSLLRSPTGRSVPEPLRDAADVVRYVIPAGPGVYELAPADALEPVEALAADTFALSEGELRGVEVYADSGTRALLGTAAPRVDGRWYRSDLRLGRTDVDAAWVVGFDAAGNRTEPVQIRNTWFVATPGQDGAGLQPNPATRAAELLPPLVAQTGASGVILGAPDGRAERLRAEYRWARRPQYVPRPLYNFFNANAYDRARDRVVASTLFFRQIWEFDGERWLDVTPASAFNTLFGDLVYDSRRGRVLSVGVGDTVSWDGAALSFASTGPTPSVGQFESRGPSYDPVRDRVVLSRGTVPEVWEFDGARWHVISTRTSTRPTGSESHSLYDPTRGAIIHIDASPGSPSEQTDLRFWSWDGVSWTLLSVHPDLSGVPVRSSIGPVFAPSYVDESSGVLFMAPAVNSFTFPILRWSPPPPPGGLTELGRESLLGIYSTGVFDSRRERGLIFAGFVFGEAVPRTATWSFRGDRIRELTAGGPSARASPAAVYDGSSETVALYAGRAGSTLSNELWRWDEGWARVTPSGPGPAPRARLGLAYDSAREEVVLTGGGETWVLDGSAWQQVSTATTPPSAAPMVYDPLRRVTVLVPPEGGATWLFDGMSWLRRVTPSAPGRVDYAAVWHEGRREVVLFGGRDSLGQAQDDLWAYDGLGWSQISVPGPRPSPRSGASLSYDPERRELLLFGGRDGAGNRLSDLWAFQGGRWSDVTPSGRGPSARADAAFVHHPPTSAHFLYGEDVDSAVWLLQRPTRPMVQLTAPLPSGLNRSDVSDVRVRAWCAGQHASDTGPGAGAELQAWIFGSWTPLAVNTSSIAATGGMDYVPFTRTATEAQTLIGPKESVFVRCISAGPSGSGFAEVTVDALEVRVKLESP